MYRCTFLFLYYFILSDNGYIFTYVSEPPTNGLSALAMCVDRSGYLATRQDLSDLRVLGDLLARK